MIGNTLFLYGQKILLMEADEWSRKWIKQHLGVEMEANREWRSRYERRPRERLKNIVVPKYTGYGTYDDSMKSVLEIDPQIRCKNELPELCDSQDIIKFSAKLVFLFCFLISQSIIEHVINQLTIEMSK